MGKRKKLRILHKDHVLVSLAQRKMYLVDYVMESDTEDFLVNIYYSPRRGGQPLRHCKDYMSVVQSVANTYLSFFPTCVSLCIYGTDNPRVYSTEIENPVLESLRTAHILEDVGEGEDQDDAGVIEGVVG